MTVNMDEGTDFGAVIASTSLAHVANAVSATYLEVQPSKISERAAGLAREIAATQPTIVGLQGVSLWRTGHSDRILHMPASSRSTNSGHSSMLSIGKVCTTAPLVCERS